MDLFMKYLKIFLVSEAMKSPTNFSCNHGYYAEINYFKFWFYSASGIFLKLYFYYLHFCAPLNKALSLGVSPTSIIFAPASSCMISPDVTIGDIPSSIRVPLFEANMTRIQ